MRRYDDEYFESIGISNDYMFRAVFGSDIGRASRLLSTVLERPLEGVSYLDDNHELKPSLGSRGSVLDIYVRTSDGGMGNIEMQDYREGALGLRLRAHLSSMDRDALLSGSGYGEAAWTTSVFICTHDQVGNGRRKHTAHWHFEEEDACLITRQEMVILYAGGTWGEVSPGLLAFLRYVSGYTGKDVMQDDFVREVDEAVRAVRRDNTWREGIVTVQEKIDYLCAEAAKEARKQGIDQERGRFAALLRLVRQGGMSLEEALDNLEIPEVERAVYRDAFAL